MPHTFTAAVERQPIGGLPRPAFALAALAVLGLLTACATAPQRPDTGVASDTVLETVIDKKHHQVAQSVDLAAMAEVQRLALPILEVDPGARGAGVTEEQAVLVANNAGRSFCRHIGKYVVLDDSGQADGQVRLVLTAIVPTGRSAAGASSVLDFFAPGPLRLPIGLGALAGKGEIRSRDRSPLAVMHWSRGANSVTNSAKLSSIGDAWQLAARFGEDFAKAAVDPDPAQQGVQHALVDPAMRKANQQLCDARFGRVNAAGRGASFLLPLSPESMDAGAPQAEAEAEAETP